MVRVRVTQNSFGKYNVSSVNRKHVQVSDIRTQERVLKYIVALSFIVPSQANCDVDVQCTCFLLTIVYILIKDISWVFMQSVHVALGLFLRNSLHLRKGSDL